MLLPVETMMDSFAVKIIKYESSNYVPAGRNAAIC